MTSAITPPLAPGGSPGQHFRDRLPAPGDIDVALGVEELADQAAGWVAERPARGV